MSANSITTAESVLTAKENWKALLELSTSEVFEMMLGCPLIPCPEAESAVTSEFTAMVGLAGSLCGVLSLRCTADSASFMASKMLGIDVSDAATQSWDAIGEVCNMIAGNFKAKLSGIGNHCLLSVPTIITGGDYRLHSLADGGTVEIAMQFEGSILWITLEIHS